MPGPARLNIRATPETIATLKRAAQLRKQSLTGFVLWAALGIAHQILSTQRDPE